MALLKRQHHQWATNGHDARTLQTPLSCQEKDSFGGQNIPPDKFKLTEERGWKASLPTHQLCHSPLPHFGKVWKLTCGMKLTRWRCCSGNQASSRRDPNVNFGIFPLPEKWKYLYHPERWWLNSNSQYIISIIPECLKSFMSTYGKTSPRQSQRGYSSITGMRWRV